MGAGLPRAAEPERAVQEGRQPAQRPGPDREHLRPPRLRQHRSRRPARPLPLVRAVHPAQARHRRRQDRHPGAARAGRRVLHAPGPHRRRRADQRAAARDRPDQRGLRPRHRRHHRPAERPAALDPGRGRARDLAPAGGRRAVHHRSLRRLPARHPRLAGGRHRRRRDHRPDRRPSQDIVDRYIGDPQFSNLPRKFKTAITGHPLQDVVPEINDVAFVGVEHPEHGPGFDLWVGGGLSTNPMLAQRLGAWVPSEEVAEVWAGVVRRLPRLRLPPAAHPRPDQVPDRGLGPGEVPRGAGERVPEAQADRRPGPGHPGAPRRPRRASTSRRTATSSSVSPPSPGGRAGRS